MREELKKFIESNIQLIDNYDFIRLYTRAYQEVPFQVGNLTMNLVNAGINPIYHMQVIPMHMYSCDILETLSIPDNIISIGPYAFDSSPIRELHLPKSIMSVDDKAFHSCYNLEKITYAGTVQELLDIKDNWVKCLEDTNVMSIQCSDDVLTDNIVEES